MSILADVYLRPARSVAFPTAPGIRIAFHAGHARVADEGSLLWALQRDDCTVALTPPYRDHVPLWAEQLGDTRPIRAAIILPPPPEAPEPAEAALTDAKPPRRKHRRTAPAVTNAPPPEVPAWVDPVGVAEQEG